EQQRQAAPRFAALDPIFSGNCFAGAIGPSGALVTFVGAVDCLLKTTAGFCAATFEVHIGMGSREWGVGSGSQEPTPHSPLPIPPPLCLLLQHSVIDFQVGVHALNVVVVG